MLQARRRKHVLKAEEFRVQALKRARQIVQQEGSELALAARELDMKQITTQSTLLGAAIAKALIEAYEAGAASKA
jgi:hypothetical protein